MNEKFHLASKLFQAIMEVSKKPHRLSRIPLFSESVPKEKSSVSSCISLKLMLKQGLIKHVNPGSFILTPLTVRSVEKLCNLVDILMHKINGQKSIFPTLIPESFMRTSGRWEGNDNLFKLQGRHSSSYCLAPTHEEVATHLMSQERFSHKSLPLRIYQITPKFRDELNPKLGLLRGKEFLMKDLYTFDSTEENAQITYKTVCNTYDELFKILGIDAVKVKGSSGDIGGSISHEFHILSDTGEDEIFYCSKCKTGINKELHDGNDFICESCKVPTIKSKAIEVGHAFILGTRYSTPFQAKFDTSENTLETYQMGCYGLGLTRIIAASIECLSKDNNIRWPFRLPPYYVSVIPPKRGSKEESVTEFANHFAESLNKISGFNSNVVIDDRTNATIGKRFQDASALGIPYAVVFGKRALEDIPLIEVNDVYNSQRRFLTYKDTLSYFRNIDF